MKELIITTINSDASNLTWRKSKSVTSRDTKFEAPEISEEEDGVVVLMRRNTFTSRVAAKVTKDGR